VSTDVLRRVAINLVHTLPTSSPLCLREADFRRVADRQVITAVQIGDLVWTAYAK